MKTTDPIGATVHISGGGLGSRRVTINGAEVQHVNEVIVKENADSLQEVTVTFWTNQATVEPWTVDETRESPADSQ